MLIRSRPGTVTPSSPFLILEFRVFPQLDRCPTYFTRSSGLARKDVLSMCITTPHPGSSTVSKRAEALYKIYQLTGVGYTNVFLNQAVDVA